MYLLYSILLTIGIIVLLPRFAVDAFRHGKYFAGLGERLGWLPFISVDKNPIIWLHCVSVGETQAARTLFQTLRRRCPDYSIVISTTTLTGQRVARDVFSKEAALVIYFPFDWAWTVRRALKAVHPALIVILETELWPNFLRECKRRKIPVAIVNGRLSERSYGRFSHIPRFAANMLSNLDMALMQSESDAVRFKAFGLGSDRVKVTGNVKFDAGTSSSEHLLSAEFERRFGFCDGRRLIVAASTHDPEERIAIEAFKKLRSYSELKSTRLLIAPRHPERFAQIAALLNESGLAWVRRTDAPGANDMLCDIILLDSIGELRAAYELADMVFVGGSIAPAGGHNILEPVSAGKCVVTGAHTSNFSAIMDTFVEAGAVVQLPPVSDTEVSVILASAFADLLSDDKRRQALIARANDLVEQNRGATERTVDLLESLLTNKKD